MKSESFPERVPLYTILLECKDALKKCECEVEGLEETLVDWVSCGKKDADMPLIEMQRLDYIRQVQTDLASIFEHLSLKTHEEVNLTGISFDLEPLISVVKLGEIKKRMSKMELNKEHSKSQKVRSLINESDVHLFFENGD
ncbi:MAG: hypothetical protein ABJL99_09855 [Aliishimia sp.]